LARMGEHTRRLLDTLSSEWQELEDVFDGLIPTVPPGKALRKYETLRARQADWRVSEVGANGRGEDPVRRPCDPERLRRDPQDWRVRRHRGYGQASSRACPGRGAAW